MFNDKEGFKKEYIARFKEITGETFEESTYVDKYKALVSLIMKYISIYMADTHSMLNIKNDKRIYYFSMEFLIGKLLKMYLINLGVINIVDEGLKDLGIKLDDLEKVENDAGLGNGGLGRLAACFLDSMAYLDIPAVGMGIRYRYGLFKQRIIDGNQVEVPDRWLHNGYLWEIRKPSKAVMVKFGGRILTDYVDGKYIFTHVDYEPIFAVPYDIPIVGYDTKDVNNLRLWSAETVDDFDFHTFSSGNYLEAIRKKTTVEAITQVLYPNDSNYEGRLLRLKQQYFLVCAGLKSILRRYNKNNNYDLSNLEEKIQMQINDTHPSLVIPELMRILMDEEGMGWNEAWIKTTSIVSYTNHTILPEALEKWPVDMVKNLLPRIFMIIEEINRVYIEDVENVDTMEIKKNNSIIKDGYVHMANLAIIGSKSVNGVAKLHTEILKRDTFRDFYKLYPKRFHSKTNGVSHRRFLLKANPKLTNLLNEWLDGEWINNLELLQEINKYSENTVFLDKLEKVKLFNKKRLADYIKRNTDISIDTNSIFDIQVKRIHEYKRQLLNALHIIHLYNQLKFEEKQIYPRTFIFGGKAAPGYYMAKRIIKLISSLADKINSDREINTFIKVVFLENFNVSLGEIIYPAADVSEQISTASKEASGTGNMKFMMNGALTIGTLDGANIEIMEKVGEENIFIFGLKSEEVLNYYKNNNYNAYEEYNNNKDLKRAVDCLINGFFKYEKNNFRDIFDSLLNYNDCYFVFKDFNSYKDTQNEVERIYRNKDLWYKKTAKNIAASGYFSSDRTIKEYNKDIWRIRK